MGAGFELERNANLTFVGFGLELDADEGRQINRAGEYRGGGDHDGLAVVDSPGDDVRVALFEGFVDHPNEADQAGAALFGSGGA